MIMCIVMSADMRMPSFNSGPPNPVVVNMCAQERTLYALDTQSWLGMKREY